MVIGHLEVGHAHHGGNAPPPCHHGGMPGHSTPSRENAGRLSHADLVGRCGLVADQDCGLATVRGIQNGFGSEAQRSAGCSRASCHAGTQRFGPRTFGYTNVEQVGDQGGWHSGHRRASGFGVAGRRGVRYESSKVVDAFHLVSLVVFTGAGGVGFAQGFRRLPRYSTRLSTGTRSWAMESRSRTVTARSSKVSKSMVTQ